VTPGPFNFVDFIIHAVCLAVITEPLGQPITIALSGARKPSCLLPAAILVIWLLSVNTRTRLIPALAQSRCLLG
jgi:hypothetical protein